ncbi:MAG: glycosyltransferase [Mariprofundales bacterium]|nr:glycosyltransferase [Mariprofundales bacterium]
MRILHVITRMDRGGSAINTLVTATEQAAAGHAVALLFGLSLESAMAVNELAAVDAGLAQFRALGGEVMVEHALRRTIGWRDAVAWWRIRETIQQFTPDVVHTHTSKGGVLGRLAARTPWPKRLRIRVVHTPHGHIFHGYFSPAKVRLFIGLERWLAQRTDVLIALTRAERDDHLALGIGRVAQWRVVPSGVDVDQIIQRIAALRSVAVDSGERRSWQAVSVGRLTKVKGMDRLLLAWGKVVQQRSDARLVIVGDGELRADLEQQRDRLGLGHAVHFAGWDDPVVWLAVAERFVLLSRNEGMGRVVVEAMAAGLPCVVADVCGLAELVDGRVGAVVDAEDAAVVAQALLADYGCEIRQSARMRSQRYSVRAMMQGVQAAYENNL